MLRRTIAFLATVGACLWAGNYYAWNPELRDEMGGLGFLFLFLVALAALAWAMWTPNRFTVVLSFGLGIAVAIFGGDVWSEFTSTGVLRLVGALAVLAVLWLFVAADRDLLGRIWDRIGFRRH